MRYLQRLASAVFLPCLSLVALTSPAKADLVTINVHFSEAGVNETNFDPANLTFSFTTEALDACLASGGCRDGNNLFVDFDQLNGNGGLDYILEVGGYPQFDCFNPGDHVSYFLTDPNDGDILDLEHALSFTGAFSAFPLQSDCDNDVTGDFHCPAILSAVSPTATAEITISSEVTPEPATWVTLSTGLIGGLTALRRRARLL